MKRTALFVTVVAVGFACRQQPDHAHLEARVAAVEARMAKIEVAATNIDRATPGLVKSAATQPAAVASAPSSDVTWKIVKIESRVTESNSSWSKYAWQLVLRNDSALPQVFDATVEFKDADGFVVDDDDEYKLVVPANSEETFTGYDLVNASVADKITSTSAKVKKKS